MAHGESHPWAPLWLCYRRKSERRKGPGGTTGSILNSVEVETLQYDLFNRGAFDDVRRSEVLQVATPLLEGHPSVRSICTLAYDI